MDARSVVVASTRTDEVGHPLPTQDPEALGRWFTESADSGSLERYLETFDHTVAVMQRADQLTRVAREAVEDLAADGVVYAEIRYAPEQHLAAGLTLDEVVQAVADGFAEGMAAAGGRIVCRQLLTAMRRILHEPELRESLAERGYSRRVGEWSEGRHLERYLVIVDRARAARREPASPYRPALARAGRLRRSAAARTSTDGTSAPR